jgi:hypothetical protein
MEWGLFVLAVLFVAVLQIVLWRRIQDGDVGSPDAPLPGEASASAERPAHEPEDPDVTLCPSCGTENDAAYEFCRECTATLYV